MTIQQKLDALPNLNHQVAIGQQGRYCKCLEARLALAVELLERAEHALLQYKHRNTMMCADLSIALPRLKEGSLELIPRHNCARCGNLFREDQLTVEEGDEWECFACNERENTRERAVLAAQETKP